MNCIVYVSCARGPLKKEILAAILRASRRNNPALGITGLLLYIGGNFMQAIEGPEEQTAALMEKIKRDPRHHDLRVLATFAIEQRYFPDWSMGWREASDLSDAEREGISSFLADVQADTAPTTPRDQTAVARLLLERFAQSMW